MYPTRTTSTTGTFHVPSTPPPAGPPVRAAYAALPQRQPQPAEPAHPAAPEPQPQNRQAWGSAEPVPVAAAEAPAPLGVAGDRPLWAPTPPAPRPEPARATYPAAPEPRSHLEPPARPAAAPDRPARTTYPPTPESWPHPESPARPAWVAGIPAPLEPVSTGEVPATSHRPLAAVPDRPARAAHPAAPEPEPEPEPRPEPAPRPGRWVDTSVPAGRSDVPAARAGAVDIPHPAGSGIPGPAVPEIVAQAVARGVEAQDGDTQDIPLVRPPRGTAVTDIPVHLPFAQPQPRPAQQPPAPAPTRRPAEKPPAGRRVPRGDDRLREHRGPVLPGWIAVSLGGLALAGCGAVLWRAGAVPDALGAAFGATPRAYHGLRATHWPPLAFLGIVALLALGGLGRAKAGHAWVLTLFGSYRGTVRRTGLTWISPLLLRRRVDVRLRHWRSEPMPAVDSGGLALQVVVQVVWQVKDTARATLAVEDHTEYLAEQVESAMARVLSQLPADAFHEDAPTLRDAEAVGDALTRMLAAETEAVGVEVFSAQPTRIEYAPEVAEAMRRRRVAAIDAKHRDTVLTSVVDAVDDTVHRLTSRGIVELDDYERKALVKDLTVAFYTGRSEQ
ncbi:SPFH domain-containing protein [Streptomyces sp. NPDC003042]